MMRRFTMNGYLWRVCVVDETDPRLVDRTGRLTLATTDPRTLCVYMSRIIPYSMRERVLIHELGHCALFSFNLLDEIHALCYPSKWAEAEEWVCNFIADYGHTIFQTGQSLLEDIPHEIERLVA